MGLKHWMQRCRQKSEQKVLKKAFVLQRAALISNARWHRKEIAAEIRAGRTVSRHRLGECVWHLLLAHFDGVWLCWSGYTISHTTASLADIYAESKELLSSEMIQIVQCEDSQKQREMVYEFLRTCMHVLDPTGGPMNYRSFCTVFDVAPIPTYRQIELRRSERERLLALGFSIHTYPGGETLFWEGEKLHVAQR